MDEIPEIEQPMATQEWVLQVVKVLDNVWDKMSTDLESRFEGMERVQGELLLGYAKQAALLESLLTIVLIDNPERKEAFDRAMREATQTMKDTLDHGQQQANAVKQRFHPTGEIVDDLPDSDSESTTG